MISPATLVNSRGNGLIRAKRRAGEAVRIFLVREVWVIGSLFTKCFASAILSLQAQRINQVQ